MTDRHRIAAFAAVTALVPALIAALGAAPAAAQPQSAEWPVKPLRLIVPFPPGGATDVVARQLAQHLGGVFGQTFIVDNRAGAAGNIGTEAIARAAPDGYTIGLSTSGPLANNRALYRNMPFDPQKDLAPIALIGEIPIVLVTHPGVKAKTLREFVALVKAAPAQFAMGHPGNGTIGHLTLEALGMATGIAPQSVPYKGDAPAMTDLLGGSIQGLAAPVTSFIPNIQADKLRSLAVTSRTRFPGLPNVPTALEQGFDLEATVWFAVVGPAGLSKAVVARLNQEINRYTASADGRARLAQFGMVESSGGPELLGTVMSAEASRWRKVVEAAKIALD